MLLLRHRKNSLTAPARNRSDHDAIVIVGKLVDVRRIAPSRPISKVLENADQITAVGLVRGLLIERAATLICRSRFLNPSHTVPFETLSNSGDEKPNRCEFAHRLSLIAPSQAIRHPEYSGQIQPHFASRRTPQEHRVAPGRKTAESSQLVLVVDHLAIATC